MQLKRKALVIKRRTEALPTAGLLFPTKCTSVSRGSVLGFLNDRDFHDSDGDFTMPKSITLTVAVTYISDDFLMGFVHFRIGKKISGEAKYDGKHFSDDFLTGITNTYGKPENNNKNHFSDDF